MATFHFRRPAVHHCRLVLATNVKGIVLPKYENRAEIQKLSRHPTHTGHSIHKLASREGVHGRGESVHLRSSFRVPGEKCWYLRPREAGGAYP